MAGWRLAAAIRPLASSPHHAAAVASALSLGRIEPGGRKPVDRRELIAAGATIALVASTSRALAQRGRAWLDHAVPAVGSTVSGSPRELRLYFTMGVATAFSGVQLTSSMGAPIPTSRPASDPSDPQIVIVRFKRPLSRGTYTVSWQMISAYGRPSWGRVRFTVT
ncbi:MAG: copper resistance protein CopC [Methylocella sp.]